jgi:hypothetical protein
MACANAWSHLLRTPDAAGRSGDARPRDGLEGLEKDYEIEATSAPSGVTHVTFTRVGV